MRPLPLPPGVPAMRPSGPIAPTPTTATYAGTTSWTRRREPPADAAHPDERDPRRPDSQKPGPTDQKPADRLLRDPALLARVLRLLQAQARAGASAGVELAARQAPEPGEPAAARGRAGARNGPRVGRRAPQGGRPPTEPATPAPCNGSASTTTSSAVSATRPRSCGASSTWRAGSRTAPSPITSSDAWQPTSRSGSSTTAPSHRHRKPLCARRSPPSSRRCSWSNAAT